MQSIKTKIILNTVLVDKNKYTDIVYIRILHKCKVYINWLIILKRKCVVYDEIYLKKGTS